MLRKQFSLTRTWFICIVLLVLSVRAAYAEWLIVSIMEDGTTVYIDSETLRHQGNVVTMWVLFDSPGMKVMDGISSRSMRAQFQIDCDQELYRSLAVTRFSGNMATGKVVSNAAGKGKWAPVAPKTVAKMLMNSQCKE